MTELLTIERVVPVPPEQVWALWTTAEGIGQWWAPDGFRTDVEQLELRPGGRLVYTMTAVAPEQVEFLHQHGLPVSTRSLKTFTEVDRPRRLAYTSLIDFVPDHEPYDHLTVVHLEPAPAEPGHTAVRMTMEPLHDDEWTGRLVAGRTNEVDNLVALLTR